WHPEPVQVYTASPAKRQTNPYRDAPSPPATAYVQTSLTQGSTFKGNMAYRTGTNKVAVQIRVIIPELIVLGAGHQRARNRSHAHVRQTHPQGGRHGGHHGQSADAVALHQGPLHGIGGEHRRLF